MATSYPQNLGVSNSPTTSPDTKKSGEGGGGGGKGEMKGQSVRKVKNKIRLSKETRRVSTPIHSVCSRYQEPTVREAMAEESDAQECDEGRIGN